MNGGERVEIARQSYRAFAAGDRAFFDEHLSDDFTFSSPPDPQLDRDGWSERRGCGQGGRDTTDGTASSRSSRWRVCARTGR
jgi:ketosteroid isomerase-like protein